VASSVAAPPRVPAPVATAHLDEVASHLESPVAAANQGNRGYLERVAGSLAILLGFGLLAQAYLAPPDSAAAIGLYWLGLTACFVGTVTVGISRGSRPGHQVLALAALGLGMYLPSFLRNPAYPLFQDELFHIQTLQLMLDYGTTHVPITNFVIAGAYPGIELVGYSIISATGLSVDAVVRIVPIAIHMTIPIVAYFTLKSTGLRPAHAFFGALVYMANWGYYWFHSTFSYESLGVLLFLLVVGMALRLTQPHPRARVATTLIVLLAAVGVVITHHISSLISIATLGTLTAAFAVVARRKRSPLLDLTLFGLVVWIGWLVYEASGTIFYLGANFLDRITNLLALFQGGSNSSRTLFWNTSVPLPEQFVAYLYPVITLALISVGLYQQGLPVLRAIFARRRPDISAARLTLAIIGPLYWLATAPGVLTRTADVIYRSWSFVFIGVALYAALGMRPWLSDRSRAGGFYRALAYVPVGLLLAGAVVLSGNQAGRFRTTEVHSSAGPEAFTEDLVSAAHWLQTDSGRFHFVIGDSTSSVAFAVWGMQKTNQGVWPVYYTPDPQLAQLYTNALRADYVTVDLRDSRYLPRYGFYFDSFEFLDVRRAVSLGQLMPDADLQKFDLMPALRRIYDNGDIIVYQNTGQPETDQ
jgi:hypothetical protein